MMENGQGGADSDPAQVVVVADDGRRMGVKVAPLGGRTHLVIADLDNYPWLFSRATLPPTDNEWVKAVADLGAEDPDYHWDTPRYRELCIQGGLDPDRGRPHFHPADQAAADELLRVANLTRNAPRPGASVVILDLIELLRSDAGHGPDEARTLRIAFARLMASDPEAGRQVMEVVERILGPTRAGLLIGDGTRE